MGIFGFVAVRGTQFGEQKFGVVEGALLSGAREVVRLAGDVQAGGFYLYRLFACKLTLQRGGCDL